MKDLMKTKTENNQYFHWYNANPKGLNKGDCAYRALSLFLNIPWEDAARLDGEHYLETGTRFTHPAEFVNAVKGNSDINGMELWLRTKGVSEKREYEDASPFYTVRDFIDKYAEKNKRYLIRLQKHIIAIVGNKVWDTWDSSFERPLRIYELDT